jgi:hypothetical protein
MAPAARTIWECVGLIRKVFFAATLVLTSALVLSSRPDVALAGSAASAQQGAGPTESAAPKSEAAEAWDAVKNTTNPALLEAFINRYGTTFFAEIAKARLSELRAGAAKTLPAPGHQGPTTLPMPANGVRAHAVLYEEIPSEPKGRQYIGSVIWSTETVKVEGKGDELVARADLEIPSRGLRMKMSLRRNLDPSLPASHIMDLTLATPADFDGGWVANVPGILMKANEQARGTPLAALTVKVTEGSFLVGLSAVPADRERNLQLLSEKSWLDIPIVYANQRRAIIAIEKGASGERVLETVLAAWGNK